MSHTPGAAQPTRERERDREFDPRPERGDSRSDRAERVKEEPRELPRRERPSRFEPEDRHRSRSERNRPPRSIDVMLERIKRCVLV